MVAKSHWRVLSILYNMSGSDKAQKSHGEQQKTEVKDKDAHGIPIVATDSNHYISTDMSTLALMLGMEVIPLLGCGYSHLPL